MGPDSDGTGVPVKWGNLDTDLQIWGTPWGVRTKMGVRLLQAENQQTLSRPPGAGGGAQTRSSLAATEGTDAGRTSISDFRPPGCKAVRVFC